MLITKKKLGSVMSVKAFGRPTSRSMVRCVRLPKRLSSERLSSSALFSVATSFGSGDTSGFIASSTGLGEAELFAMRSGNILRMRSSWSDEKKDSGGSEVAPRKGCRLPRKGTLSPSKGVEVALSAHMPKEKATSGQISRKPSIAAGIAAV